MLSTVSEKHLLRDIAATRKTYSNGDLSIVARLASKHKADSSMLRDLVTQKKGTHPVTQWILSR